MAEDQDRTPFSALRAWTAARDDDARERARARLDAHIATPRSDERSARAPRARRRRWAAPVLALLLAGGAAGAVAAVLLRTAHTGHLPVFTAQGTLSPQFRVATTARGYCFTASLAAAGEADAYRCFAGNAINDPCFAASAHARTVACFLDPWHPVTLLRLTRPLPRHGPLLAGALPWAIETESGLRCTYFTGATAPMGGERINYGCTKGWFLIGAPDTRQPLWTIRSSPRYIPDKPGHPTPLRRFPLAQIKETIP
jgi:hypothetical protein